MILRQPYFLAPKGSGNQSSSNLANSKSKKISFSGVLANVNTFFADFLSQLTTLERTLAEGDKRVFYDKILETEMVITKAAKELKSTLYKQVSMEVIRVIGVLKQSCALETEQLLMQFIKDIQFVLQIRKELAILYSSLAFFETIPAYEEVMVSIQPIYDRALEFQSISLSTPIFMNIKKSLCFELEILYRLLCAQMSISKFQFLESIMLLFSSKRTLTEWKHFGHEMQQQQQHFGGGSKKSTPQSGVSWSYAWLSLFYSLLVSKMSIYFYYALRQREEESGGDAKSLSAALVKTELNFFSSIESLAAKTDASNISFIIDNGKLKSDYTRNGYVCKVNDEEEASGGLKSWPAAFSYPKEPPIFEHWPNIISVIFENSDHLNRYRDPISFYDRKVQCTYFISQIEPHLYVAAIYDKKKDSDTSIKDFINSLVNYLRGFKLLDQLKSNCFQLE